MGVQWKAAQHRRAAAEAEIELLLLRVDLLIARLDREDGDPDMEDSETGSATVDWRGREMFTRLLGDECGHDNPDAEPDDEDTACDDVNIDGEDAL